MEYKEEAHLYWLEYIKYTTINHAEAKPYGAFIIKKERERAEQEKKELRELTVLLNDYNDLLGEEIKSLLGIASVHGWKSERAEKGRELREAIESKIEALKK